MGTDLSKLKTAEHQVEDVSEFFAKFRYEELASDILGTVVFDSLRAKQLQFNMKLVGTQLITAIAWQLWGLKSTDIVEYAGMKILFNTFIDMITAKIFGSMMPFPESLITNIGSEALSFTIGKYGFRKPSAYVPQQHQTS